MKFGKVMQLDPPDLHTIKTLNLKNRRQRRPPSLKNQKIAISLQRINQFWPNLAWWYILSLRTRSTNKLGI